jgi:methionine aminopeptidase
MRLLRRGERIMISIKSEKEIQKMREICKIVAKAHEEIKKYLKVRNNN